MNVKLDVPYYKQNRDYTCGPTCLRMVMEFYGVKQDEVALTMLCGTTIAATSLSEMAEAAQGLGFKAEWKTSAVMMDLKNALRRGTPVIVFVDARLLHNT